MMRETEVGFTLDVECFNEDDESHTLRNYAVRQTDAWTLVDAVANAADIAHDQIGLAGSDLLDWPLARVTIRRVVEAYTYNEDGERIDCTVKARRLFKEFYEEG